MASVEGGYNYYFMESPPDRLVCKICQFPCREVQLTECCGHMFCKCCLNECRSSTAVSIYDVSQACPTYVCAVKGHLLHLFNAKRTAKSRH